MTKNIIITSTITAIILSVLLRGACVPPFLPALIFGPMIGGMQALLVRVIQRKLTKYFNASDLLGFGVFFGVVSGIVAAIMAMMTSGWLSC